MDQNEREWLEFLDESVCRDVPMEGLCSELQAIRRARLDKEEQK